MTDKPTTLERARAAALWLRDSFLGGFGFALVLVVALSGWAASFIGLHHFGVDHMGLTDAQGWLVPLTFDGAPAGLSIVVMRAATHGRTALVWRLLIVGFTGLSSWINYAHITDPTGRLVASFMPPSAVILFEGLMSEARAAAQRRLGGLPPRLHPLRWFFDRTGTLDIYRRHILGLELPAELQQAAVSETTRSAGLADLPETPVSRPVRVPETAPGETETGSSETNAATRETRPRETRETAPQQSRETGETTPRRPETARSHTPRETKTPQVIPIRDPDTETQRLLDLMWSRGSEKKVSLADAETETGRPKPTAARRLKAARDHYKAGRRDVRETRSETANETSETDTEPEPAATAVGN